MRYVITHGDKGVLSIWTLTGHALFTKSHVDDFNSGYVWSFPSAEDAQKLFLDNLLDGIDSSEFKVVGVETSSAFDQSPRIEKVTYEELRAAGLSDLLPEENLAPAVR